MNRTNTTTKVISTSIDCELHRLAKENGLMWSEIVRVGVGVLLAEKGYGVYDQSPTNKERLKLYNQLKEIDFKAIDHIKNLEKSMRLLILHLNKINPAVLIGGGETNEEEN